MRKYLAFKGFVAIAGLLISFSSIGCGGGGGGGNTADNPKVQGPEKSSLYGINETIGVFDVTVTSSGMVFTPVSDNPVASLSGNITITNNSAADTKGVALRIGSLDPSISLANSDGDNFYTYGDIGAGQSMSRSISFNGGASSFKFRAYITQQKETITTGILEPGTGAPGFSPALSKSPSLPSNSASMPLHKSSSLASPSLAPATTGVVTQGAQTSLKVDSAGNPKASYLNINSDILKYVYWDGSVWQKSVVDDYGKTGYYSSLALSSLGNPRISYYYSQDPSGVSTGDLKYAYCNSNCKDTGLLGGWQLDTITGSTTPDISGNGQSGITTLSNTNIALSGTASASGTHSSYNVNGPKDGQGSTWGTCPPSSSCSVWAEASATSLAWWQVDLGSSKNISRVKVDSSTTGTNAYYKVQLSTNGSTWTDMGSTTVEGWVTFDFTPTAARYVRVQETANTGNSYLYLIEVEVYNVTPPPALTTGKVNNAFNFDGTSSSLQINSSDTLENVTDGSFTMEAWANPQDVPPPDCTTNNSTCRYAVVARPGYHTGILYDYTQVFKANIYNSSNTPFSLSSAALAPGAWHHLVLSVDDDNKLMYFYVDGQQVTGSPMSYTGALRDYGTNPYYIGVAIPTGTTYNWFFKGSIDEVAIYNRALDVTEITGRYNAGSGKSVDTSLNVAANWATTTVDSTGDVGGYTSIALDPTSGNPRIAYYDFTNMTLKYAYCDTACENSANWSIITIDSAGYVGMYTSLALDPSGNPRISYYDYTNGDLKYAYCDSGCNDPANWIKIIAQSYSDVGMYTSLALDPATGYPRISYYDTGDMNLYYGYTNGTTGTNLGARYLTNNADSTSNQAGDMYVLQLSDNSYRLYYAYYNGSYWQLAYKDTISNTRYEETSGTKVGTWTNTSCGSCSGSWYYLSTTTGNTITFSFTGNNVKWIGKKDPTYGIANVYIDNVLQGTVDLYNSTTLYQQSVWNTAVAYGSHTIKIEVSGTKNASSTGYGIAVDAVDVGISNPNPPTTNLGGIQLLNVGSATEQVSNLELVHLPDGRYRLYYNPNYNNTYQQVAYMDTTDTNPPACTSWNSTVCNATNLGAEQILIASTSTSDESGGGPKVVQLPGGEYRIYYNYANGAFTQIAYRDTTDTNPPNIGNLGPQQFLDSTASLTNQSANPDVIPLGSGKYRIYYQWKGSTGNWELAYIDTLDTNPPNSTNLPQQTGDMWGGAKLLNITDPSTEIAANPFLFQLPGGQWRMYYQYTASASYGQTAYLDTFLWSNKYEDTDPAVTIYTNYTNWSTVTCGASCSGGTYITSGNGYVRYVTLTFTGTNVGYIATKGPAFGYAYVYIDNVLQATVNLYNPTTLYQQTVWSISGLTNASHTIKVQNGTGSGINFDAFVTGTGVDTNPPEAGCCSWNATVVDGGNDASYNYDMGGFSSLALDISGNPVITYYYYGYYDIAWADFNALAGDLKYASCTTGCNSSANWTKTTIDSTDDTGWFTSTAITNAGTRYVTYYDSTTGDLKILQY